MLFLGPSKMRMNQKTHQLKQYKTRGHVGPFGIAIVVNITFSKCARVKKERTSENRMNQGIGVHRNAETLKFREVGFNILEAS